MLHHMQVREPGCVYQRVAPEEQMPAGEKWAGSNRGIILMAVHVAAELWGQEINYRKWRHIKGKETAVQSFWLKGPH